MGIFGNLMNNYFYGKSGKGDYRVQDMPANRRQLFGAVLKVRWGSMCGINLVYALCWLPAAIWTIFNIMMLFSVPAEELAPNLTGYFMMYLLILAPCIAITGPFSAGIAYVMRNWARDEHSFVLSDFWDAVKGNWKQGLLVSIVSGLMPITLYLGWTYYGQMASENFIYMVPLAIVIIVFIVWKLSDMIMYTMMVTYKLTFKNLVRNSVLLTMAKMPLALLIKVLTLLFPIAAVGLMLIVPGIEIYVFLVVGLLYLVFIPAFNRLLIASYSNALCEKYLNTRIEGAATNIGLRPENWDDTEYIPEDDE